MKQREAGVKDAMSAAKDAAKKGDKDAAIAQLRVVLDQKCLFPKQAKDAANELKKLGVTGARADRGGPELRSRRSARR